MNDIISVLVLVAIIGCMFVFVAWRFVRLACAMKRLKDAANRLDVAGGTACSACAGTSTATGPVFRMYAVGIPPPGMAKKVKMMLPMCPKCHMGLIRFDFWCTAMSLVWSVAFLAVVAFLISMTDLVCYMTDLFSTLRYPNMGWGFLLLVYVSVPAIGLVFVRLRYYKRIIGLPSIAKMVQTGYSLVGFWNNEAERPGQCDWVELIGDETKYSATTGLQRVDDHECSEAPQTAGLGRGIIVALWLMAIALAVGPAIIKFFNSGFHVGHDVIFGNAIPISLKAWGVCINVFLLLPILICIIYHDVVWLPRGMSMVREASLLLLATCAAYALHVFDAYLCWGAGMSMYAATCGFVFGRLAVFMFFFIVAAGLILLNTYGCHSQEKIAVSKRGGTPRPVKERTVTAFRVALWWTILSLVLFELHIAVWFLVSIFTLPS